MTSIAIQSPEECLFLDVGLQMSMLFPLTLCASDFEICVFVSRLFVL